MRIEQERNIAIRPAATILAVRDDPFEVLMVERHHKANFGSALVFPGGGVDAADAAEAWLPHVSGAEGLSHMERTLRIAAVRETFEETGLLFAAYGAAVPPPEPGRPFLDLIRDLGATLLLDAFHKIGHWITPAIATKRYDTHFYVARAPQGQEPVCDGHETVSLEWLAPDVAVRLAEAGERQIIFPTRMNLKRLAESADSTAAIAAAAQPPFTVCPLVERTDAGVRVTIPAEAGYGVTEELESLRHLR